MMMQTAQIRDLNDRAARRVNTPGDKWAVSSILASRGGRSRWRPQFARDQKSHDQQECKRGKSQLGPTLPRRHGQYYCYQESPTANKQEHHNQDRSQLWFSHEPASRDFRADLANITTEYALRRNVTIDRTVRQSAQAKLRVLVKRVLRKHGYPPDKQEKAAQTVLEQAELLADDWAA